MGYDYFENFITPVMVVDEFENLIFANKIFYKVFDNVTSLERFSHKINFDFCPLNSEDVNSFSPIHLAIKSLENFSARIQYINNNSQNFYYDIYSYKEKNNTVIIFSDVTNEINNQIINKKLADTKSKIKILENKISNLEKIKEEAQIQAFKIALNNKITKIIQNSGKIDEIINATLKELSILLSCFKSYYAQKKSDNFYNDEVGNIQFEQAVIKKLKQKKNVINYSMKECLNTEPFKQPVLRIIVPIFYMEKMLGIIVLLSHQKQEIDEKFDILYAVSTQLGNAIVRADLYQKNSKNVKDLRKALNELKSTQLQLINSEKMASLGQLVAGVAHEINTPVASIKSNNEIFSKLIEKIDDEKLKNTFLNINKIDKEAVKRITNIVVTLKKFVRLDEAELQYANINTELDLTLDLIKHETKNRIKIEKFYGKIPEIKCYPNMLNQVFTNILVNACQAIEGEGIIKIITECVDNRIIVKISDTGHGIAKNDLDKIFTAGYTTRGVGVGTGLGLAISKKIIEKHNGEIKVFSELGRGTEFVITINC